MPAEPAIANALFAHLDAFEHSPPFEIAFPNLPFTPPTNAIWLRATLLPGDTVAEGISWQAQNRHVGILQIDIFAKPNDSLPSLHVIASLLAAHFKRGTTLTNDGISVKILDPPSIAPVQSDAGGLFLPVRVSWVSFAPAPSP